jgi:ABC-type dipeptide/oligopeptide/nickel transport system permease component
MDRVFNLFGNIGRDKLAHFFSASLLLFVLLLIFSDALAISIVLLTAIYKELVNDKILKRGKL